MKLQCVTNGVMPIFHEAIKLTHWVVIKQQNMSDYNVEFD